MRTHGLRPIGLGKGALAARQLCSHLWLRSPQGRLARTVLPPPAARRARAASRTLRRAANSSSVSPNLHFAQAVPNYARTNHRDIRSRERLTIEILEIKSIGTSTGNFIKYIVITSYMMTVPPPSLCLIETISAKRGPRLIGGSSQSHVVVRWLYLFRPTFVVNTDYNNESGQR